MLKARSGGRIETGCALLAYRGVGISGPMYARACVHRNELVCPYVCGFRKGTVSRREHSFGSEAHIEIQVLASWDPFIRYPNIPEVKRGNWLEGFGALQAFSEPNKKRGGFHSSTCHSYQIKLVALVTSSLGRIWDCRLGRGKNWRVWRVWGLKIKGAERILETGSFGRTPGSLQLLSDIRQRVSPRPYIREESQSRFSVNSSGTHPNCTLESRGTFQKYWEP